jgi:hypothetical protein
MSGLADRLRSWRRRLKASLPYVRRREHRVLQRKYADLIAALDGQAPPASSAAWQWLQPVEGELEGEVCLFVAFAEQPRLKAHVADHVAFLAGAGLAVVLVVNTDQPADALVIEPALRARTRGIAARANAGYDFGAWAHALALLPPTPRWSRLFLVNDSMVGPLDAGAFERLLARIRGCAADVVGLTEALLPRRHLQSYFLVFGPHALQGGAVARLFARVRNWPAKLQVIDVHETRLTGLLEAEGLRTEALFPSLSGDALSSDDTSLRWAELVERGLPYLKTRVVEAHRQDGRIVRWLSARPAPPG